MADVVAARATGVGAGLVSFMVVWVLADRIAGMFWGPPAGPVVAMSLAVVAGIIVSLVAGARLVTSLTSPARGDRAASERSSLRD